MAQRSRGRPVEDRGTRDAIIDAARRQFAERGFTGTTLRSVAGAAGVDHRLVIHYFGSKGELFQAAIELPVSPEQIVDQVFSSGHEEVGRRAAELIVSVLGDATSRASFLALLRAAVTEPEAATLIRDLIAHRLLLPIATRVGGDAPELRASMLASSIVGLTVVRHVLGLEPLLAASDEQLVAVLTPVADFYLSGDWVIGDGSMGAFSPGTRRPRISGGGTRPGSG